MKKSQYESLKTIVKSLDNSFYEQCSSNVNLKLGKTTKPIQSLSGTETKTIENFNRKKLKEHNKSSGNLSISKVNFQQNDYVVTNDSYIEKKTQKKFKETLTKIKSTSNYSRNKKSSHKKNNSTDETCKKPVPENLINSNFPENLIFKTAGSISKKKISVSELKVNSNKQSDKKAVFSPSYHKGVNYSKQRVETIRTRVLSITKANTPLNRLEENTKFFDLDKKNEFYSSKIYKKKTKDFEKKNKRNSDRKNSAEKALNNLYKHTKSCNKLEAESQLKKSSSLQFMSIQGNNLSTIIESSKATTIQTENDEWVNINDRSQQLASSGFVEEFKDKLKKELYSISKKIPKKSHFEPKSSIEEIKSEDLEYSSSEEVLANDLFYLKNSVKRTQSFSKFPLSKIPNSLESALSPTLQENYCDDILNQGVIHDTEEDSEMIKQQEKYNKTKFFNL